MELDSIPDPDHGLEGTESLSQRLKGARLAGTRHKQRNKCSTDEAVEHSKDDETHVRRHVIPRQPQSQNVNAREKAADGHDVEVADVIAQPGRRNSAND